MILMYRHDKKSRFKSSQVQIYNQEELKRARIDLLTLLVIPPTVHVPHEIVLSL